MSVRNRAQTKREDAERTESFNDLGEGKERLDVGVAKIVGTSLRGVRDTGSLETGSKEFDVSVFIGGDSGDVKSRVRYEVLL